VSWDDWAGFVVTSSTPSVLLGAFGEVIALGLVMGLIGVLLSLSWRR